jgi:hypothetical protein
MQINAIDVMITLVRIAFDTSISLLPPRPCGSSCGGGDPVKFRFSFDSYTQTDAQRFGCRLLERNTNTTPFKRVGCYSTSRECVWI